MLSLFGGLGEGSPERGFTLLPVKHAGLDLPELTLMDPEKWTASCVITGHLIAALRGQVELRMADHVYSELQKSLHQEWAFMQRATPGI